MKKRIVLMLATVVTVTGILWAAAPWSGADHVIPVSSDSERRYEANLITANDFGRNIDDPTYQRRFEANLIAPTDLPRFMDQLAAAGQE